MANLPIDTSSDTLNADAELLSEPSRLRLAEKAEQAKEGAYCTYVLMLIATSETEARCGVSFEVLLLLLFSFL